MRFPPVSRWIFVFIRKKTGEAGLSLSKKSVIARSEATRQSVIFSARNLRKAQDLYVLETDYHASLYPKGTCFAARTGSQ